MILKQSIINITWDGTLNKVSHKLDFPSYTLIDKAYSNYYIEKWNVDVLLAYIGLTYLDKGYKMTIEYIAAKIFPAIIECHQSQKVDYVEKINEIFSEKFHVYPRWE